MDWVKLKEIVDGFARKDVPDGTIRDLARGNSDYLQNREMTVGDL